MARLKSSSLLLSPIGLTRLFPTIYLYLFNSCLGLHYLLSPTISERLVSRECLCHFCLGVHSDIFDFGHY